MKLKTTTGTYVPVTGLNYVLMDMNSFIWVSRNNPRRPLLRGGYAAFCKERSNVRYPREHQWRRRVCRLLLHAVDSGMEPGERGSPVIIWFLSANGPLRPSDSNSNVGSGYWTHTVSSGQTLYPTKSKSLALSAFEIYEFHTTQEETGVHPGQTFAFDYSAMLTVIGNETVRLQIGPIGYEARQTTAKTGPPSLRSGVKRPLCNQRSRGGPEHGFPKRKVGMNLKYFKEFADRSTFEGYSLQLTGTISF